MSLVRTMATLPSSVQQCLDHPQLLVVTVLGFWCTVLAQLRPWPVQAGSAHLLDFGLVAAASRSVALADTVVWGGPARANLRG